MDSISQFTLGAAIGEAVLGKKIGNKAILWGGLAGTIPDLDVVLTPFFDDLAMLTIHRGYSHALLFSFVVAPLLAWLVAKWYQKSDTTYKEWFWLFFLGLLTHPILDAFTTYGTQLFLPFSDYRVGINNLFIVDPFYTVPFFLCILTCLFLRRDSRARRIINYAGLTISCLYICFTLGAKVKVNEVFKQAALKQNINYQRMLTGTTPLQSILWYGLLEVEDGYLFGYYSLFDKDNEIKFDFIERKAYLIEDVRHTKEVDRIIWFSKGFYAVRENAGKLFLYDIKFGRINLYRNPEKEDIFVFPFEIEKLGDGTVKLIEQVQDAPDITIRETAKELWKRIQGIK